MCQCLPLCVATHPNISSIAPISFLPQIEMLEARASSGSSPPLDPQQVSKVSQKAALQEALHVSGCEGMRQTD